MATTVSEAFDEFVGPAPPGGHRVARRTVERLIRKLGLQGPVRGKRVLSGRRRYLRQRIAQVSMRLR